MKTSLYIKNMVCPRCISSVRQILIKLNIPFSDIRLGEVTITIKKEEIDFLSLDKELRAVGFELIDDKKSKIISQIKTEVINYIRYSPDFTRKVNFSDYLAGKVGHDYPYLSKLFSSVEAQTIEKYIILQKIERVKELLIYNELSLSEISYEMEYSSVQHLSRQFKDVTGITPTAFKKLESGKRKSLDEI
ncbi:MAG: AraC family transcriptional regulator [Bacteroidales bacterium]|nr:AraC family transcriptional regulator [Bacteroidales bacterium]